MQFLAGELAAGHGPPCHRSASPIREPRSPGTP